MSNEIWVLIEKARQGENIAAISRELLGKGRQLADASGERARLGKRLRDAHHIRQGFAEVRAVFIHLRAAGTHAGHEGSAARIAQRILAVGFFKAHAGGRELVDVRRFHLRMPVAAEGGV